MWRVFIHNDDVTPFDFVISILERIFELNAVTAQVITYTAHTAGIAYVTTLPRTEAQQRVGKAHFAASLEGFPLTFTIEPE
jgi:ATP-dependent Clp protease adaptor protein ClpS